MTEPDLAFGGASCPCGITKVTSVQSDNAVSLSFRCSHCGGEVEVLPTPLPMENPDA
jgi:hypothetical protein